MKKIDVLKIYIFLSLIYLSYNLKNFKNLNQNFKKESITKLTINNPKTDNSLLTMKIKDTDYHFILGGVCQTSYDKLIKTYENIPKHNEIKIEAQYHFIGKWEQNTGYLQVNLNGEDQYVWTGRCKSLDEENYIYDQGMCGYKICKIGEIIKVSLKHNDDKLKLTFGSTLTEDDACVQSYGISEIKIFIR